MSSRVLGLRPSLEVTDVARSIAFYQQVLGLEPVTTMGEPPTFALLAHSDGEAALALAQADAPAVAAIAAIYATVADADARHELCTASGVKITVALTTHPWQMRDFVVSDPDGHQIAIGQEIG